jgi:putative redox protein
VSLTATARSVPGTLRQDIVIDGRHRLTTDQPVRLGGGGTAPAPHELFPAALAACVASTLALYGRTKEWDLGEITVDVDYDHHSTPRRFDVEVHLTGDLDVAQLARLKKVAAACPLRRSIETGIEFAERVVCTRAAEQAPKSCAADAGRAGIEPATLGLIAALGQIEVGD